MNNQLFRVTCNYYKGLFKIRKSSHSQIIIAKDLYEASDIYEKYHESIGTFKNFNIVSHSVQQLNQKK